MKGGTFITPYLHVADDGGSHRRGGITDCEFTVLPSES